MLRTLSWIIKIFISAYLYVSRANSSFLRRSSVASIISAPIAWISFKFYLLLPLGHMPGGVLNVLIFLFFFWFFFYEYLSFLLTWWSMGAKTSKRFSQTSPEFSSQWVSQKYVWDFWNFENWNFNIFVFVFVNMGPNGSENFKTLLLLQIAPQSFQTCPEFSSQCFLHIKH